MKRWTEDIGAPLKDHPEYTVVHRQYQAWLAGMSKNDIERNEYNDVKSHGKLMSQLFRDVLGIETEKPHPLQTRVEEQQAQIVELRRIIEKKNRIIHDLKEQMR